MNIELIDSEIGAKELVINNKSIGEFIKDVDGYYYFWPNPSLKGSWNANALNVISEQLDLLNKKWDDQVTSDLAENIRPWGEYHILHEDANCKVKKIIVNPAGKLSYQYHYKRNEVWTITEGHGIFTLDDREHQCKPGDTLVIPTKAKHMIENTGDAPLVFIEVQRGSYFGEDDIVRINDVYGRS